MNKPVKQINIYDAKTQLSSLVDKASKGESFVIAKAGTPMAKLVPAQRRGLPKKKIKFGSMKGKIRVCPMTSMLRCRTELLDLFYGEAAINPNEIAPRYEHRRLDRRSACRRTMAHGRRVIERRDCRVRQCGLVWEIAIKAALGKLDVDVDLLEALLDLPAFERLPVTWQHGRAVRGLAASPPRPVRPACLSLRPSASRYSF